MLPVSRPTTYDAEQAAKNAALQAQKFKAYEAANCQPYVITDKDMLHTRMLQAKTGTPI